MDLNSLLDAPYQLLPPLSVEEYEALKADIEERGILIPIEFDEEGNILDGHHRFMIASELGIEFPSVIREGLTEQQKRSHARSLNTHRRHLSREVRRMLIADELRENPQLSNAQVAKLLGVSDHTVAAVRAAAELESTERIGADGKTYKVTSTGPVERLTHTLVFKKTADFDLMHGLLRAAKSKNPGVLTANIVLQALEEKYG